MNDRQSFPHDLPLVEGGDGLPDGPLTAAALARMADFYLGAATVRPSLKSVEGPGGTVSAEPRVMQVLIYLALADGRVVGRDELIEQCWQGIIVGDDAINRAIGEVRKLARTVEGGFAVETIPRIGFRMAVEDQALPPAPETERSGERIDRRAVAAGLVAVMAGGAGLWAFRGKSGDPAAPLIAQAREAMIAGGPQATGRAESLLAEALRLQPQSAAAWGLLALVRARKDEHAPASATPLAAVRDPTQRALQLDPDNADAAAAMAIAIPYYGDWLAAERRFDAVLARHPDQIFARDSYNFFLGAVGRMRESAENRLAMRGDTPLDPDFQTRLIYSFWFLDRIGQADSAAARGLDMWPRHPGIWFARLWVQSGTGRLARAIAHIDDVATRPPLPPPLFASLRGALVAARSREPGEIARAVAGILAGVSIDVANVVNAMMLLNLLGAIDAAFDLSEAYYLEQGPLIAATGPSGRGVVVTDQRRRKTNMLFTPVAVDMRRDTRFMPLMQRMGLTDYWKASGNQPDFLA